MFRKTMILALLLFLAFTSRSLAAEFRLPAFLPEWYRSAFTSPESPLALSTHTTKGGVESYRYATEDISLLVSVDFVPADASKQKALMSNLVQQISKEMDKGSGAFISMTKEDLHATFYRSGNKRTLFVYAVPSGIQIWVFRGSRVDEMDMHAKFHQLLNLANRQRYLEAVAQGNVAMGAWGEHIYAYARLLLEEEKKQDGLSVLAKVIATTPSNFQAHLDILRNTPDAKAAENSARIILRNAEDPDVVAEAMKYLGVKPITNDSLPVLTAGEAGLQVVLIPLDPCDLTLLQDVAKTYEKITGIPVKLRRLPEPWSFAAPDRIAHRGWVHETLIKMTGKDMDFSGWSKDRYMKELRKVAKEKDPQTQYIMQDMIKKIKEGPGQYFVNPYLDRFSKIVKQYRSADKRTMYVGVTGADIYSGNENYLFSSYAGLNDSPVSILSHHMMQAKNTGEAYESRTRLIERLAKELVPASLKTLEIPRSTDQTCTDQTCPYSYANSVQRLDEKALQLSQPVQEALDRFRR